MITSGVYLGLDIGGTKIGLCVGTPDGRVLASDRVAVDHALAPEAILSDCKQRLLTLLKSVGPSVGSVLALGAACPGPLDYAGGRFINPPNNPRWHGFALRDWLKANFECPSAMMNDANAAAYAEWLWGAARGAQTAVFLTFSTGMGAGLIIDGRLHEGPLGLAGEIGRIKSSPQDDGPVGFGRRGSIEGYCSGPGLSQMAHAEAIVCTHTGESSVLREALRRDGAISPQVLCDAARAGDAAALRVIERSASELGRLMGVMTDILNPQVFVLGTIGSAYPDLFIPRATKMLREVAIPAASAIVEVRPSTLTHRGDQQALAVAAYTLRPNAG
ncbi:MAG: ROK family protein [Phycisphaerales bacterium]|nr:ROK family protein [Phycisphaerales bacterium]